MIKIKGARVHNLKNLDLELPHHQLIVLSGVSGSGKSSLAFDTIYAEGERRYVESLSSYAKQFLQLAEKPDVDSIEGLSPAIAIRQKTISHNPRSTVGTVSGVYDYLRVFMSNFGIPHCPVHRLPIKKLGVDEIIERILTQFKNQKIQICSPVVMERKGNYIKLLNQYQELGYSRIRVDDQWYDLEEVNLNKNKKHSIDILMDRIIVGKDRLRLAEAVENSLKESEGLVRILCEEEEFLFSSKYSCVKCHFSIGELHPRIFSFNLPAGACEQCFGIGYEPKANLSTMLNLDQSIETGALIVVDKLYQPYRGRCKAKIRKLKLPKNKVLKNWTQEELDLLLEPSSHFEGLKHFIEHVYRETTYPRLREHYERFLIQKKCSVCEGHRLLKSSLSVYFKDKNIADLVQMDIAALLDFFSHLTWTKQEEKVALPLIKEIRGRLGFLSRVGLYYLTLGRPAQTLSGGEAQRIRLASQIGNQLNGVLYVLDEPTIGLHQRDNDYLIQSLLNLRDLGNTVIIVEHDEQMIRNADFVVDVGPYAGVNGGKITNFGDLKTFLSKKSITSDYLSGREKIEFSKIRKTSKNNQWLEIKKACTNNLKGIDVRFPLGVLTVVTGVSGSGKSSLIQETLIPALCEKKNWNTEVQNTFCQYEDLLGFETIDEMISITQKPIGRSSRSNPATYHKVFDHIRMIFAQLEGSLLRGYTSSRFSFNIAGGRCDSCMGKGTKKVEMHFLADVEVLCEVCQGKCFNQETLEIKYKGRNIYDVLQMTVDEAIEFFNSFKSLQRQLRFLQQVGLGYICLGQPATQLSGGEAQRLKLAKELSRKKNSKHILYILDEPTTGLHFADIHILNNVLKELVNLGHTMIIIEHNLDVIKTADYIIDIGPEGGQGGGELIAYGTPEEIVKNKNSYTGQYLQSYLK